MNNAAKMSASANPNNDEIVANGSARKCRACGTVYWHGIVCGCAPRGPAISVDSIQLDIKG